MIKLNNVSYKYPYQEKKAVHNLNLEVNTSEIAVVTGVSGCGKSTLIRLINGLCPHYYGGEVEGEVIVATKKVKESNIGELSTYVGSLFQDPEQQFFALNVDDELAFVLECKGYGADTILKNIDDIANEFGIKYILSSTVNNLSEGQKQKVGLASIILQHAKVIILDEPTANLDVESTNDLADKLLKHKNNGYTILIVDHRLYWTKDIADKYYVMSYGEIVANGSYDILLNNELREKYGLRDIIVEDKANSLKDCYLEENKCINVENITFGWKNKGKTFNNVSFNIPYGITAILGKNGAGKTTLARLLTGLTPIESGTILIKNEKINKKLLHKSASLVLQNADFQLYMRSTYEEIYTSIELSHKDMSNDDKERKTIELLTKFDLSHLKDRHPQSLSGGEKQRLVIACAVAKEPDIIILDEPTSGLDGKNMQRIANILEDLTKQGVVVIVITHDLELMNKVCKYALRVPVINNINKKAV